MFNMTLNKRNYDLLSFVKTSSFPRVLITIMVSLWMFSEASRPRCYVALQFYKPCKITTTLIISDSPSLCILFYLFHKMSVDPTLRFLIITMSLLNMQSQIHQQEVFFLTYSFNFFTNF